MNYTDEQIRKAAPCKRCRGTGTISVKHGTTYITDDADEIANAYRNESCTQCKGLKLLLGSPSDESRLIKLWRYEDAPEEYQNLSPHGGDEDWLMYVPSLMVKEYGVEIELLVDRGRLGVSDLYCHILRDGSRVYVGAHA